MKNKLLKSHAIKILLMLFFVVIGYNQFHDKAFTGSEAQGTHIWLSASTVKFVNNWLKEGALNLNFIMYEYPDSIEFNNIHEREAYISYPPGTIIPVYLTARLLNRDEIQLGFLKQFLRFKYLADSILICLIIFSFLVIILNYKSDILTYFLSLFFTYVWIILPINLYYLRNVYFSDQMILTVVFFYTLLLIIKQVEIKNNVLNILHYTLMIITSIFGILTDWYFCFVIFISWLVQMLVIKLNKSSIKYYFTESIVYVFPVFIGLGLFTWQVINIPDYSSIIRNIMNFRIYGEVSYIDNNIIGIIINFINNYSILALLILIVPFLLIIYGLIKKEHFFYACNNFLPVFAIIFFPPFFQILILQNHSAVHEFSMLKFSLPIIISIIISITLIFHYFRIANLNVFFNTINEGKANAIKIPVIIIAMIFSLVTFSWFHNDYRYITNRMGVIESFEREMLIRENTKYEDVIFSFTESISANPPMYLAVSKKAVYQIDSFNDIHNRFPNLTDQANILFIIKNSVVKNEKILHQENEVIKNGHLQFFNQNFSLYSIDKSILH